MADVSVDPKVKGIARDIMAQKPVPGATPDELRAAIGLIRTQHPQVSAGAPDPSRAMVANVNLARRAGQSDPAPVVEDFLRERIAFRAGIEAGPVGTGTLITIGGHSFGLSAPEGDEALAKAIAILSATPIKADKAGLDQVEAAFATAGIQTPSALGMAKGRHLENADTKVGAERVFDEWSPRYVSFDGMRKHPTALVEAKTLASVKPPRPTIMPMLREASVKSGAISDAQLEAVTLAVNAHELFIERIIGRETVRHRKGFLYADGTGAGKSNGIAGIIEDSWNRGRHRHVIVLEKAGHRENFERALGMIGTPAKVHSYDEVSTKDGIAVSSGVITVTYAMLRTVRGEGETQEFPVAKALATWLAHGSGDGVLAYDEAHNLRNAPDGSDIAVNVKEVSLQGIAAMQLEEGAPRARVVYASATGATNLHNLAYMGRLGLWGPETPYVDFSRFYKKATSSNVGLEMIPLHMKSSGTMVSRTLSLEGVVYQTIMHRLTLDQIDQHKVLTDLVADTMLLTYAHVEQFLKDRQGPGSVTVKKSGVLLPADSEYNANSSVVRLIKESINRTLELAETSMAMPTVLADADAAIAAGKAPVFQISRTLEAELVRSIDESSAERETNFAAKVAEVIEGVIMPVAKARAPAFASLAARWREIPPMSGPLDQILTHFGRDQVAEVTGRSVRRIPRSIRNPAAGYDIEIRKSEDAAADRVAFQDGKKHVLVFSTAFGGTGYEYHAVAGSRNERQRYHYVLETGYQADIAIQGIGRTHRSGQASAPRIGLTVTDLPGDSIRNANVIRSIAKLGALSMGHREASTRSLFDEIADVSTPAANQAVFNTVSAIRSGQYPEIRNGDYESWRRSAGEYHVKDFNPGTQATRFFKSLRYAPLDFQRAFFSRFLESYAKLPAAMRDGIFEDGPHVMKQAVEILSSEVVHYDEGSRERIEAHHIKNAAPANFREFEASYEDAKFYAMEGTTPRVRMRRWDRAIVIQAQIAKYDPANPAQKCWRVYTPDGVEVITDLRRQADGGAPIPEGADPAVIWRERTATLKAIASESRILVTGSILRIEPLVAFKGARRRLVIAPTTTGSQLAGYLIPSSTLEELRLTAPEMAKTVRKRELEEVEDAILMRAEVTLENGMSIGRQTIPGAMLPRAPEDRLDPKEDYLTVAVPKHAVTGAMMIWLRKNDFLEVDVQGGTNTAMYARPLGESAKAIGALLSISSVESMDAP